MSKKFKHLEAPYSFKAYYSKYPQGYTIFEALLDWLDHVNSMSDTLNITIERYAEIDKLIHDELSDIAETQLQSWLDDGTLEEVINDALFNTKADKTELIELQNLIESKLTEKVNSSLLPIMFDGTKTLQETIEQAVLEDRPIQVSYGEFEINENIVVDCNVRNVTIRGYGKSQSHPISRLIFRNDGVGLTLNNCQNFVLEDIDIVTRTVGDGGYIVDVDKDFAKIEGSIKVTNVFIRGFNRLFIYNGGYYHTLNNCVFSHFRCALFDYEAYNVQVHMCNFRFFDSVILVEGGNGPVSFNQCVFESFTNYIIKSNYLNDVKANSNLVNSYIENPHTATMPDGLEFEYTGTADIIFGGGPITFTGNFIYGNMLRRIIWAGDQTKSIVSKGNSYNFPDMAVETIDYIVYNAGVLDWVDISDTVTNGVNAKTTFISGLPTLLAKGNSRVYNMYTKEMEV